MSALLSVPFGDPPASGWPAIIFNHGFIPPDEYRTTERYVAYVDGFARNGYIVFRSDYRGHGDSDGLARRGGLLSGFARALAAEHLRSGHAHPNPSGLEGNPGGDLRLAAGKPPILAIHLRQCVPAGPLRSRAAASRHRRHQR